MNPDPSLPCSPREDEVTVEGSTGTCWSTREKRCKQGWPDVGPPANIVGFSELQPREWETTVSLHPEASEQAGLYAYADETSWVKLVIEGANGEADAANLCFASQVEGSPFMNGELKLKNFSGVVSLRLTVVGGGRAVLASYRTTRDGQWTPVPRGSGWVPPEEMEAPIGMMLGRLTSDDLRSTTAAAEKPMGVPSLHEDEGRMMPLPEGWRATLATEQFMVPRDVRFTGIRAWPRVRHGPEADPPPILPGQGLLLSDLAVAAQRVAHGGNRTVPPNQWGMTVGQFNKFVDMCRGCTATWRALAASTDHGKRPGIVNGYQLCEAFVKPLTRGTGCGVALLLNPEVPLEAEAMMSHTWAEDILEVQEAINDRAAQDGRGRDLVIWFCIFANYQPGDSAGPTISEQLLRDPFGSVIRSPHLSFMCLLVTSTQDPYERLWCVYELDVALDVMDALERAGDARARGFVAVEFSQQAVTEYRGRIKEWVRAETDAGVLSHELGPEYAYYRQSIKCEEAKCGSLEDQAMITAKVQESGGWERLNRRMASFRMPRRA